MSIKKLVDKLDKQLTEDWGIYIDLHNELNKHRGKPIEDTDLPEVNRLLNEIQERFIDLNHAFHFVNYRHQMAINAIHGYTDFIDTIKKAGAEAEKK